jgi:hypothetical protein
MGLPIDDVLAKFSKAVGMSITGGTLVRAVGLSVEERTATVGLVRELERGLFPQGWEPSGRVHLPHPVQVERLNELRVRLGWLQVDPWGCWRWPY